MKKTITFFLVILSCLLTGGHLSAQDNARRVEGTVTAAGSGEPLPGVSVVYQGSPTGTSTDAAGHYSLQVPDLQGTLVFSSIGYRTLEASIGNRNTVDVGLEADVAALEEVVVIGYGTQQRKDLTGSIASVSAAEIDNQPAASVDQLLQGRAAGVDISPSSGAPGGRASIRIRGASSVNAGNEPLLVIDGIPMYNSSKDPGGTSYGTFSATNALASLNPNDIESVDVLKDASATAIYGSRGSNGVIIITTKRGKQGRAHVDYNGYYGTQQVVRELDLMNGREHAEFLNDWAEASGLPQPFSDPQSIGEGTDWQGEIFRSAPIQNHQISVSGGNENTKYYISGNYYNQDGIVLNSGLERYSLRVNVDQRLNSKLNFSQSLTYNRTINRSVPIANAGADNVRSAGERAYAASPTAPVFDENGEYVDNWYGINKPESPVASLLTTHSRLTGDNLLGNLSLDYEIIDGLTFRTMVGVNLMNRANEEYYPGETTYIGGLFGGLGMLSNRRITNILNENTLRFSRIINNIHSIEVLGGFTWQTEKNSGSSAQPTGFPDDRLGINSVGGTTGTPAVESSLSDWSIASFIGRVNYQYDNKYLLTATLRADGSSRFASGNKWGYFPSFALGYRLSEENFVKELDFFDDLKLRASYGLTGNQEIGNYQSLSRLVTDLLYIFDNQLVSGARQSSLANRALTWEKSGQWDVGLDLAVFNSRLRLSFDYYKKDTRDLLFTVNLPSYSGFSTALYNTGSLENKGIELDLSADVLNGDFSWSVHGNYARNRAEMTSLGKSASTSLFIGHPPGVSLGYIYDGVFHNDTEIAQQTAQAGVHPGDIRYKDTNNDGEFNADDRILVGNPIPDYIFGLGNSFSYKNFSLNVFLQGVIGQDANKISRLFDPSDVSSNKAKDLVNRWTLQNTGSDIPRAGVSNWLSSTFLRQDLSFVKIRNIQLGYTLPMNSVSWLRTAHIYLSGQNLFTFAGDYFGYDPDTGSGYPTARTVMLGLNLGF